MCNWSLSVNVYFMKSFVTGVLGSPVGTVGIADVYNPRPWVAAITVLSDGLSLSISVRTLARPPLLGIHWVAAPRRELVVQTPSSVPNNTPPSPPVGPSCAKAGANSAHRIDISDKLPSTLVKLAPPFILSYTLIAP